MQLTNQLVEAPGTTGGYYKVTVQRIEEHSGYKSGVAYIPDLGKRTVIKRYARYAYQGDDFAWSIQADQGED